MCRQHKVFVERYNTLIPIGIKFLVCLRILARGNCSDDINEFSQVGESTCNFIFKQFLEKFVDCFFDAFQKGTRLQSAIKAYGWTVLIFGQSQLYDLKKTS